MVLQQEHDLSAVGARFQSTIPEVPRFMNDHRRKPYQAFAAQRAVVRPLRATKDPASGVDDDSFGLSIGTGDYPALDPW
jgi:hypothetical protein